MTKQDFLGGMREDCLNAMRNGRVMAYSIEDHPVDLIVGENFDEEIFPAMKIFDYQHWRKFYDIYVKEHEEFDKGGNQCDYLPLDEDF